MTSVSAVVWIIVNIVCSDDNRDLIGRPLGGDFGQFYFLGREFWKEQPRLFDVGHQVEQSRKQFGEESHEYYYYWPIWYAPVLSVVFAPLAVLPFVSAFAIYSAMGCVAVITAVRMLVQNLYGAKYPLWVAWCGCGFLPVAEGIIGGQLAPFLLLVLALSIKAMLRGRYVLAGFLLGITFVKPSALLIFSVVISCCFTTALIGVGLGALSVVLGSLTSFGIEVTQEWISRLALATSQNIGTLTDFSKVAGFSVLAGNPFYLVPRSALAVAFVVAAVALGCVLSRAVGGLGRPSTAQLMQTVGIAATANVLLSPYCPIYDVSLLLPGLFVILGRTPKVSCEWWRRILLIALLSPHVGQAISGCAGIPLTPMFIAIAISVAYQASWPEVDSSPVEASAARFRRK